MDFLMIELEKNEGNLFVPKDSIEKILFTYEYIEEQYIDVEGEIRGKWLYSCYVYYKNEKFLYKRDENNLNLSCLEFFKI